MIHHHLILPNELNHNTSLFGGAAMGAADKAAYIEAALAFPLATFVTKAFEAFNFLSPAAAGDILEITTEILHVGNSSVQVGISAKNARTKKEVFETKATFVNVENGQKAPIPNRESFVLPSAIEGTYTNWREETGRRSVVPLQLHFGSTAWHQDSQWLLKARDTQSGKTRDFALKDFDFKSK